MAAESKEEIFVREGILIFGFLGGLFLRAGVDPEGAIIDAFASLAPQYGFWFWVIGIGSTGLSILGFYAMAGIFGLILIAMAFLAGALQGGFFLLLIIAVILAPFAMN